MEKFERKSEPNRLLEDRKYYEYIRNSIIKEFEYLKKYDEIHVDQWYWDPEDSWGGKINKIKAGEKISAGESEVQIVTEVAQKCGLSITEQKYLYTQIFRQPKPRNTED